VKIAIYTICKDESKHVERYMDAHEQADGVFILDTGSEDDSVLRLRSRGAIVNEAVIQPWDFAEARNVNLAMVPDDYDVCLCVDMDEWLMPGWREEIERNWSPGITRINYWYSDGERDLYWHHKFHSRHGYVWRYPIHEELVPLVPENACWTEIRNVHQPDESKPRSDYLPLLEKLISDQPNVGRHRFYLIQELMKVDRQPDAVAVGQDFLSLDDQWDIDRAYMCMLLADMGQDKERWLMQAVTETPHWREPWFTLACHLYADGQHHRARIAAEKALALDERVWVSYSNEVAWGPEMHALVADCQLACGMRNQASGTLMRGCRAFPDSELLAEKHAALLS
jgi:hypothetical protein